MTEQAVKQKIMVVDGQGGDPWLATLPGAVHQPWNEADVLAHDGWVILNARGDELKRMLGPCFRHRLSFALPDLQDFSEEEARRLQATAKKRKSRGVVLGAWRLQPVVATVKEVISGGSLGTLNQLNMQCGDDWLSQMLGGDVMGWLQEGQDAPGQMEICTETVTVKGEGDRGMVQGTMKSDGSGRVEWVLEGHGRYREFGRHDVRKMELGVMKCLGVREFELPGLMTCAGMFRQIYGRG